MKNKPIAFIGELMKDRTEEELLEAEHNFREYLQVVWDIFQRLEGGDFQNTLHFIQDDEKIWEEIV